MKQGIKPVGETGKISRNRLLLVAMVILGVCAMVVTLGVTLGFQSEREVVLSGKTMGTTYHIKAIIRGKMSADHLQRLVDERLVAVNRSMSIFDPKSEISRFNRAGVEEPVAISPGFQKVMVEGMRIHGLTKGAWDATVSPLVELWGFGRGEAPTRIPQKAQIAEALKKVGLQGVGMRENALVKRQEGLSLNLGSIAKGYGVDALAELLKAKNVNDFLVEVGGEVYAEGHRKDGRVWRVGISSPERGAVSGDLFQVRTLQGQALATSGDYRNYLEVNGRIWTHVIDPRTGYPVENGITSASVQAGSTLMADGLATALMVMGAEEGVRLVESLKGVECLLIERTPGGDLRTHASSGWVSSAQ